MNKNKGGKATFKQKGANILNAHAGINNIKEFLESDSNKKQQNNPPPTIVDPPPHPPFAQTHTLPNAADMDIDKKRTANSGNDLSDDGLVRIHVHIRKDLADRLLEEVYLRKRNSQISKKEATQRAVFEQALSDFFSNSKNK